MPARELKSIGIVNMAVDSWTAGGSYTRMLVHSLSAAVAGQAVDLCVLTKKKKGQTDPEFPATKRYFKPPKYAPGERTARRLLGLPEKSEVYETAVRLGLSVVLPLMEIPCEPSVPTIGWIPDFQHVHWPQFFTESTLKSRDQRFRSVIERAALVMLSSRSAAEDYAKFAPELVAKARVVSFPSLFAFHPPPEPGPEKAVTRFHLPEKFALVANQFWKHKNHIAVIEAVAELRRGGIEVPVVLTGQMSDYRDPQNALVSSLMQAIAERGLAGQVIVLGQVSYADLIELMRTAAVAIQPSMSEGWNTFVQDSKALGRPLICSDLAVHREQVPEALGFFPWDQPSRLAEVLGRVWAGLEPGTDSTAETAGLAREREFARDHGRKLLSMCRETLAA